MFAGPVQTPWLHRYSSTYPQIAVLERIRDQNEAMMVVPDVDRFLSRN